MQLKVIFLSCVLISKEIKENLLKYVSQTNPLETFCWDKKHARLVLYNDPLKVLRRVQIKREKFQLNIACQNILVWARKLESLVAESEYPTVRNQAIAIETQRVLCRGNKFPTMYKITRLKFIRKCR